MTDTNSKSCWDEDSFKEKLEKRIDGECEEGKRIKKYLCKILPNWQCMKSKYLHEQIRYMLKNAEEIRRFEIELVWKRAIYFVPIMLAFFTAFSGVFYIIFATDVGTWIKHDFLFPILLLIALANVFLSFCLAMINLHSRRWQRNWEYHVDYLQAILGIKLMRACLKKKVKCFTIGEANVYIGFFVFFVWVVVSLFSFLAILGYDKIPTPTLIWTTVSFVFILICFIFAKCFGSEDDTKSVSPEEIDIRVLQDISYSEEEYDLESKPDSTA